MISVFWFRRDLRLEDNAGLYHALKGSYPVLPVFIFDRHILDDLTDKKDARVDFIHQAIQDLSGALSALGSSLLVLYDTPEQAWEHILKQYDVGAVYTNHDYEPYALEREERIKNMLQTRQIPLKTYKDHVIFEKNEVLKDNGTPYTVFTPYSKRWLLKLESQSMSVTNESGEKVSTSFYLASFPTLRYGKNFWASEPLPIPTLESMGFQPTDIKFPSTVVARSLVSNYDKTRNYPALAGTSRLGIHFRFGTISIREKARHAQTLNATYLNELIWRDFYSQILAHFPQVATRSFRAQYDLIAWRDAPDDFEKWCAGKTGYPIVDAGMRELNTTGFMHNRVRMITASFLTKHLLLDWRMGEAYFAQKLLDFDLASNNGGWQWAAGCGTDAAPYFRIFNPTEQTKKFDAEYKYIRKWVPEFGTPLYPRPMVDHVFARERCLATYKQALKGQE